MRLLASVSLGVVAAMGGGCGAVVAEDPSLNVVSVQWGSGADCRITAGCEPRAIVHGDCTAIATSHGVERIGVAQGNICAEIKALAGSEDVQVAVGAPAPGCAIDAWLLISLRDGRRISGRHGRCAPPKVLRLADALNQVAAELTR